MKPKWLNEINDKLNYTGNEKHVYMYVFLSAMDGIVASDMQCDILNCNYYTEQIATFFLLMIL